MRDEVSVSSDEALMLRVAAGDMAALGQLFERYKGPLYRFLYRLAPAVAEDLLQEAFLRVYDRRRTYKAGAFATWLYTIAHHIAIDHLRKTKRRGEMALEEWDAHDTGPEGHLERTVLADALVAALRTLPEDQRVAVILREYEGFSYREIGQITGATEEAARVRAHRGRQALKVRLAPFLGRPCESP